MRTLIFILIFHAPGFIFSQDCNEYLQKGHDAYSSAPKQAIIYYEQAINCQPVYPEAQYWLAMTHYKLGDNRTSADGFSKALEQGYNRSDALLYRAYSHFNLENLHQAISDLTLVEAIDDKNRVNAIYWRGRSHYALKQYNESAADFLKAASLGYDRSEVMLYLGYSNWMLNKDEETVQNLSAVINIGDKYVKEALFWRGRSYYEQRNYKVALTDFNEALLQGYNMSDALLYRGFCYYMLQDYEMAKADLEKVAAMNDHNYESAKKWADISSEKIQQWSSSLTASTGDEKPKIYAVIAGVARYNHIRSLSYTDDDAYKLSMFFKGPEGGSLPDDQLVILIDEDATKQNIIKSLENTFAKAGPNDVVFFYFAGHGKDGAFLPIDYNGYDNELTHASISEIFQKSKAKHKICIADACHSGSMDRSTRDAGVANVLETYYDAWQNSSGGMALMMSSKSEETSLEIRGFRQGVFSYFLIKGLKGEADLDNNKIVTIQEIYTYVNNQVREYTGYSQNPVINGSFDRNMPVSVVRQ